MKLKLPRDISGYNLETLAQVMALQKDGKDTLNNIDVMSMVRYVSAFTKTPYNALLDVDVMDLKRVFHKGVESFGKYKKQMPPQSIIVDGVEYEMMTMDKQKGGWYIDVKVMAAKFDEQPELVAALNYVEKGMKYSHKNDEGFLMNPTRDRAKIFREHFPADIFLDLSAFFLAQFELLTEISLELSLNKIQTGTKNLMREILHSDGSN